MKVITQTILKSKTLEEYLPGFTQEYPYIATESFIDAAHPVPWHWHKALELFYVQSGELIYEVPGEQHHFPTGSGGLINTNILHAAHTDSSEPCIIYIHLFDPSLIAGEAGSRFDLTYVKPLTDAGQLSFLSLDPHIEEQLKTLELLRSSFSESRENAGLFGHELRLRSSLSEIWLHLLEHAKSLPTIVKNDPSHEQLKAMILFLHQNYTEKLSVSDLSGAAFISERECYRVFNKLLHTTPNAFIKDYRLEMAARLLRSSYLSITEVGHATGLGNTSYFGKTFRQKYGASPNQYRKQHQKVDR